MSRVLFFLVLLTSALASGCAGNRENLADTATAALVPAATAVAAAPVAQAAPDQAATSQAAKVVDGNQLAQRSALTPICRDMLRPGSNVLVRRCMTAAQWKAYQRQEAQQAGELVRSLQRGGPPDHPEGFLRRR
jgi:hypothetical protein